MDDYTREMMDLKTLVTRTLEKKGVLAKIRAELRASVFEAIEEEDRVIEQEEGLPPALLVSCNDRAEQLHASPSGRLLTALNLTQVMGAGRRLSAQENEFVSNLELHNNRRSSSSFVASGLPPVGRTVPSSQASERSGSSSMSGYRKDEHNWSYDDNELPEDILLASSALENLQLDRKARNVTT